MAGSSTSVISGEKITQLIEPVVTQAGFELEDLALQRVGRAMVLRVVIDGDVRVSLDDAAAVSGAISRLLDGTVADQILGATSYTLEVTSPGVERPLTTPRHWRRNTGRLVRVTTPTGEVQARVKGADDTGVTLDVDTEPARTYPYEQLGAGVIVLEFRRHDADDADDDASDDDASDEDTDTEGADDKDAE